MADDEQRYTLYEATRELARRECAQFGHSYETEVEFGTNEPRAVYCSRCEASWPVGVRVVVRAPEAPSSHHCGAFEAQA